MFEARNVAGSAKYKQNPSVYSVNQPWKQRQFVHLVCLSVRIFLSGKFLPQKLHGCIFNQPRAAESTWTPGPMKPCCTADRKGRAEVK